MEHEKIWKYCKMVEQKETGEIILHENNLQALVNTWSEIIKENDPITICSFIGPQSCGKSLFFSNLFVEYAKMYGSLSWTKRIKREVLQGFSYGVEPNNITVGQLIPEKDINALYFHPELLKLKEDQKEEFICVLHIHCGDRQSKTKEVNIALDTMLAMMSSILVNVMWEDKNTFSDINELVTNSSYLSVKDHLTGNVIHVLSGAGVRDNENVIHLEESSCLHDNKGLVKLSYQQYSAVNNLMKAMSTTNISSTYTLSNILGRFKEKIKILNLCYEIEKPLPSSAPESRMISTKAEVKTVDEYKPESKRLPKRRKEFKKENTRMPKEIENKMRNFFSSQFSQQAKPEINRWINNIFKNQNFVPIHDEFDSFLQYFNAQNITEILCEAKQDFETNQRIINQEILECIQNFHLMMDTQFEDVPHFSGNALRKALNNTLALVTSDLKFQESKEYIYKASRNMFKFYYQQNSSRKSQKSITTEVSDDVDQKFKTDDGILHSTMSKVGRDLVPPPWPVEGGKSDRKIGETRFCSDSLGFVKRRPDNKVKLTSIPSTSSKVKINQDMDLLLKERPVKANVIPATGLTEKAIMETNEPSHQESVTKSIENESSTQIKKEIKKPVAKHLVTGKTLPKKVVKTLKQHEKGLSEKSAKGILTATLCTNPEQTSRHLNSKMRINKSEQLTLVNQSSKEPTVQYISSKLPPILFKISLSRVCIALLPQMMLKNNSTPISINVHPGEVGILMDGNWVCGDNVNESSQRGLVQKCWSFEAIFSQNEFEDTATINGNQVPVTLPFLMGVFFEIMKRKVENQQGGKILAAMISVPYWFSTSKRIQTVEAATIAGFKDVQLVNENTASAYYAYTNLLIPPNDPVVIISENSNRVDMSIYLYDHQSNIIFMEGQSGDYEKTDKGFFKKFVQYFFNDPERPRTNCGDLRYLENVWLVTKSRIQNPCNLDNPTLLIFHESTHWRDVLLEFAAKLTLPANILVRNDSPLLGLASFLRACCAEQISSVELLFKDGSPFDLVLTTETKRIVTLKKNTTYSSCESQQFRFTPPELVDHFSVSEDCSPFQRLGTFHMKFKPPPIFTPEFAFKRVRNGILLLNEVNYFDFTAPSHYLDRAQRSVPNWHYEWHPCKTTDETLALYISYIDHINSQTSNFNEHREVEEKAVKIKKAIYESTDKFRTNLGKNLVVRQIDDVIEALKQPGIQENQLKKHIIYLNNIVQKYELLI